MINVPPAAARRSGLQTFTDFALAFLAASALGAVLTGCAGPQIYSNSQHQSISLKSGSLRQGGVAFITPSTVTGQEEDKQALALAVGKLMCEKIPGARCVSLASSLGLINGSGLAPDYKKMYEEYRDTGIFKRETLKRIGEVTRTRYLIQLKLASFVQGSKSRFGVFGLRIVDTSTSNIRLFFQVWDSSDGSVAWEGSEELSYAFETAAEQNAAFRSVVEEAANRIIANLP